MKNNTPHPRFLARIMSHKEKTYGWQDPHLHWLLWAVKEAAYKACKQENEATKGTASLFEVSQDMTKVSYEKIELNVKLITTDDFIFSCCHKINFKPFSKIVLTDQSQSLAARKAAQLLDGRARVIKDRFGIPKLISDQRILPLSLTHHKRFAAASTLIY